MTSMPRATVLRRAIRVAVILPEWRDAITVYTSLRATPRMIADQLIEASLLDEQYRYSCRFITSMGRVLDAYSPLRDHGIGEGEVIRMQVRKSEPGYV